MTSTRTAVIPSQLSDPATFSRTSFLDGIEINHGPTGVLGRFFLSAENTIRELGITISIASLKQIASAQLENKASWALFPPMLDVRLSPILETMSLHLPATIVAARWCLPKVGASMIQDCRPCRISPTTNLSFMRMGAFLVRANLRFNCSLRRRVASVGGLFIRARCGSGLIVEGDGWRDCCLEYPGLMHYHAGTPPIR